MRKFCVRHNSRTNPQIGLKFFAIASVWTLVVQEYLNFLVAPTGGAVGAKKGGFSYILSIISASEPARDFKSFLNDFC